MSFLNLSCTSWACLRFARPTTSTAPMKRICALLESVSTLSRACMAMRSKAKQLSPELSSFKDPLCRSACLFPKWEDVETSVADQHVDDVGTAREQSSPAPEQSCRVPLTKRLHRSFITTANALSTMRLFTQAATSFNLESIGLVLPMLRTTLNRTKRASSS